MKHAFAALLLLLPAVVEQGAESLPVTVSLELPYASVLPGVPFDLTVVYKNNTAERIAVGRTATVIVTPRGSGPVRLPNHARIERPDLLQEPRNIELEPGETQRAFIAWDSNCFFDDAAVTGPGTY